MLVKNNMETSDPDIKDPVVTSQTEESTETSVSQKTQTDDTEKYEKIVDEIALKYIEVQNVLLDTGEQRTIRDYSDEYSLNGKTYYKVSDPRFSSKQDIYEFTRTVYKSEVYTLYYEKIETKFLENQGKLYIVEENQGKEWLFDGWMDEPAQISCPFDNSIIAVKKYKMGDGNTGSVTFDIVKEMNGEWRIFSSSLDDFDQNQDQTDETSLGDDYTVFVDKISAQNVYTCSQPYTMPETINSYQDYDVVDIRDKESVYVRLNSNETKQSQIGMYNFVDGTYSAFMDITTDDDLVCVTDDYIIIQKFDLTGHHSDATPPSTLSCYDIKQKTSNIIYENIISTMHNSFIYDNYFYFDGYISITTVTEKNCGVFKYNLSTGELMTVRENALMPVLIENSVAAMITNPETGIEDTIQIIEGDDEFNYNIEQQTTEIYYSNNGIYQVYSEGGVCDSLKELKTQNKILSCYPGIGPFLDVSGSSDHFIGLSSGNRHHNPSAYDVYENKFVLFDNLPESVNSVYVKDDYGVIFQCYTEYDNFKEIVVFKSNTIYD